MSESSERNLKFLLNQKRTRKARGEPIHGTFNEGEGKLPYYHLYYELEKAKGASNENARRRAKIASKAVLEKKQTTLAKQLVEQATKSKKIVQRAASNAAQAAANAVFEAAVRAELAGRKKNNELYGDPYEDPYEPKDYIGMNQALRRLGYYGGAKRTRRASRKGRKGTRRN